MKPLLQVALDEVGYEGARQALAGGVGEAIDIIEAGTLFLAAEGCKAVKWVRQRYPNKKIVADLKMADAGAVLAPMMLDAGADYMTIICAADPQTMAIAHREAGARGKEMQIELYGPWTMERARQWREIGLGQIIYHHSRDAGKEWGNDDLTQISALCDLGYKVTVTGGLTTGHIKLFAGLPIFAFIVGRSLRNSENPGEEVHKFKAEIDQYWV